MGRSVVVTGAGSGIGLATALRLAGAGYEVIATARSTEKAEKLAARAEERGLHLQTLALELTDADACHAVFAEIAERTGGGPWAVVNNAGVVTPRAVEDVTEADARRVMDVNVHAPARIARLVLPGMRSRGEGRIVNVTSMGGRVSLPLNGWYCASKSALRALTDALRMENAALGVHAILVEPGFHTTALLEHAAEALHEPSTVCEQFTASYRATAVALRSTGRYASPDVAAAAILRALRAPRPKACYRAGTAARLSVASNALLPTVMTDRTKKSLAGLAPSHLGLRRRLAGMAGLPGLSVPQRTDG
ncbi:SDR family NAD(P)-dependent oxidoreductase [Streptomyces sp. NPDC006285]|uniref:SDR family NAD(P)-dependent oxidoreductase n=1 Tax=Streptomyces sp. NPDC006285 TaxID=3364742 RepID=UPI0036B5DEE7